MHAQVIYFVPLFFNDCRPRVKTKEKAERTCSGAETRKERLKLQRSIQLLLLYLDCANNTLDKSIGIDCKWTAIDYNLRMISGENDRSTAKRMRTTCTFYCSFLIGKYFIVLSNVLLRSLNFYFFILSNIVTIIIQD